MLKFVGQILRKDYWVGYLDKQRVLRSLHRQYVWFAVLGAACLVLDTGALVLLVQFAKAAVLAATAVSFIVATAVNYWLNVSFVFEGGKLGKSNEILFFFVISAIAFFLTLLLMFWFVEKMGIWYLTAKVITVVLVSILTFFGRKFLIFKR